MNRDIIELKKPAFEELIRSCIENPRKECFGYLFGYIITRRTNSIYVVETAHNVGNIRRYP